MKGTLRLLAAACLVAPTAAAPAVDPDALFTSRHANLETLALRAYVWGMPLVEAGLIRQRFGSPGGGRAGSPLSRFVHHRKLAGPEMKAGVGPNNDTIYSLAWLDLAAGPVVLSAPDFGSRYYTFSINQADSSSEQSLGARTHGGQLPPLFIHGPDYQGPTPAGMIDVPSHSRFLNIAGRILVRGEAEYPLVHALQDQIRLVAWADWSAGHRTPAPPVAGQPLAETPLGASAAMVFFTRLGGILLDWPVRPEEATLVRSFASLGLVAGRRFEPARLTGRQRDALEAGFTSGSALVKKRSMRLGVQKNGWTINYRGARFGRDFLLRAAVAKDQIFVAVPEEAIYPVGRVDSEGRPLSGGCRYRIRFEPDQRPPVNAFWSVTAYDDQGHMIPNPINRYSVGDRTAGLVADDRGRITIGLSASEPGRTEGNWLPTGSGTFYLMMRLYWPRPAVLAGAWSPPAIERRQCS